MIKVKNFKEKKNWMFQFTVKQFIILNKDNKEKRFCQMLFAKVNLYIKNKQEIKFPNKMKKIQYHKTDINK